MMNQAIRAIALTDDFTAIRALEQLQESIQQLEGYGSRKDLEPKLEALAAESDTLVKARAWLQRRAYDILDEQQSIELARQLLVSFAEYPDFSELVRRCVAEFPDEKQTVGKTLAEIRV